MTWWESDEVGETKRIRRVDTEGHRGEKVGATPAEGQIGETLEKRKRERNRG
jgi:hypothetical protein